MPRRPTAALAALALITSTTAVMSVGAARPAVAADSTAAAVADGYVDQAQAGKSFGGARELLVASAPSQQRSYVRFDVPPTSGGIARAVLRLRPIAPGSDVAVAIVPNATWSEKQLTWAKAPDLGAVLGGTALDSTGWAQLDVTDAVAAAGSRVAFALLPAPGSASFASREVPASAPRLVLTAAGGGASPSPSPTASATASPSPSPTASAPTATGTPYRDEVLADDPIAYWRFDESSGTTASSVTGEHHGSYVGAATLGAAPGVTSDGGTSVALDGKDDTVRIPHATALAPSGALSLETWINPRSLPTTSTLIRKDLHYLLRVAGNGSVTFRMWKNGAGQDLTSASGTVKTDTWSHVVGTWDGAAMRLYVNGALLATKSLSGPVGSSTTVLEIGSGNGYDFLPGSVDDTAVYGQALSAGRIQSHSATGRSAPSAQPSPTASPSPTSSPTPSLSPSPPSSPTPTPTTSPTAPPGSSTPYRDAVLADGAAAFWQLDEASGTIAASSTGSHAGSYVGSPSLAADPGVTADGGTAVSLDGRDDTVRAPHAAGLSAGTGLTLETWVNPRSMTSSAGLVRKNLHYLLRLSWDGAVVFRLWKGGVAYEVTTASGLVSVGQWAHVVGTWDGSAMYVYINGTLRATRALSGPVDTSSTTALYLASSDGYDFFAGSQDDTAVYPHALSGDRIGAHWTTSGASSQASPVLLMAPAASSTSEARPNIGGRAGTAPGDAGTVQLDVWAGSSTAGAPALTVDAAVQKAGTFSARTPLPLSSGMWTVRVRQASASGAVGRSSSSTFLVDAEAPPRLLLAGDIAGCDTYGDEATAQLLDRLPGTVATVGDHAYQDGTQEQFEDCYDPTWGRHRSRTRPTVGGHEYKTPGAAPYYAYFGSAAGDPAKGYYSYDLGSWHVVSLNDSCPNVGGCEAGSPQEQWLRADLAASTASCTVAILHTPRFSSGKIHGSNPTMQPLWQALYDHGADVVVSGHEHFYERLAPLTPSGALDTNRGIRQFVAGMGGRSLYAFGSLNAYSEARDDSAYGVLSLTLRQGGYDWELVPEEGKSYRDAGSASCH